MTIPMAIVDFIPVGLFLAAAIILQHDLYNKMSKGAFALFAAGTIMIFSAGFLKALWKLLYAMNVCDFVPLNKMFFPLQSLGFILAGIAVVCMLFVKQGEGKTYSVALPVVLLLAAEGAGEAPEEYSGTMIFVAVMILGVIGLSGGLAIAAGRKKQILPMILYILSIVLMLGMGYLSSKDFSDPNMHWAAEAVNVVGQGCFFAATLLLHKTGFADQQVEREQA